MRPIIKKLHLLFGMSLVLGLLGGSLLTVAESASVSGAATVPSSQGTSFWVAFESNCTFHGCGIPSGPGHLYLFISGNTATSGTVSDPAISFTKAFTVTPGTTTVVDVPSTAEDDTSNSVVSGGAVHISAGAPVSAYGLNTLTYTTDGFLGLPTDVLGTSYIVEAFGGGTGSQFEVVGTQNDTTVTITPNKKVSTHTAGTPYTVTLNQGDEYQLVTTTVSGFDTASDDLTGTTITSNKPVAVFAGNDCADVPVGYAYCNTLATEMTPTNTWGTSFLTEPLATRSAALYRVMASENGTTVDIDGSSVATLNADQYYQTELTTASVITANKPVQLMQYSNSETYDSVSATSFDLIIPPTEQFLNSYTISTEPTGADPAIHQNYLNIVAPTSEVSSITLDGSHLPSSDFSTIAGTDYSGAQVAVAFGSHTIKASLPFGLSVYGYGTYDGYGYPGGFTLSHIVTVTKVVLSPTTSSHDVGTSACETATVTNQETTPLSGIRVDFTVKGANPNAGFAYSNTSGVAQYCYTGTTAGTDTETAAIGEVLSNSATITWTKVKAPPAPTTTTTSLSAGSKIGTSISVTTGTAVTDQASLSGANASKATGSVTYTVYSNASCTTVVKAGTPEEITTPGTLPASSAVTLTTAGTYYWKASYSGDTANAASSSVCGATGEVETVTKPPPAPTKTTTLLSGGSKTGTSISVTTGTAVTDQAALSGANASKATGSVTYTVYSNASCTTVVKAGTPEEITTPGTLPASSAVTLTTAGTYYWKASYSGDTANAASSSTCGATGEVETVTKPVTKPAPTAITTKLLGSGFFGGGPCWWAGDFITVFAGTAVTDSATLSGANVSSAGGTVIYTVYGFTFTWKYPFFGHWQAVASGGTVKVTDGVVPNSNPVTLPPGFYEWQASYSGDAHNAPSTSQFGSEAETVVPVPTCKYGWYWGWSPGCKLPPPRGH